jgi:hypothetical protein
MDPAPTLDARGQQKPSIEQSIPTTCPSRRAQSRMRGTGVAPLMTEAFPYLSCGFELEGRDGTLTHQPNHGEVAFR